MRILLYFTAISLVALTMVTFVLYSVFSRTTLNEIGKQSEYLLSQRAQSTLFIMNRMLTSSLQLTLDSDYSKFALEYENDPGENFKLTKKMADFLSNNPFVESLYIVNAQTNLVISSINGISEKDNFFDAALFPAMDSLIDGDSFYLIPRQIDTNLSGKPYQRQVVSLIIPFLKNTSSSTLIVNINLQKLQELYVLENDGSNSSSNIYLTDDNYLTLSHTDSHQFMKKTLLTNHPQLAEKVQQSERGWYSDDEHTKSLVVYVDIAFQGWQLVQVIPQEQIFQNIRTMRNLFYLFYIIISLVTVFTIWRISNRIYSPIGDLVKDVKKYLVNLGEHVEHEKMNEVLLLSRVFSSQGQHIETLSNDRRNKRLSSKEAFLKELLNHTNFSSTELVKIFQEHQLRIDLNSIAVVMFRIDDYQTFKLNNNPMQQKLLKYAICNIVEESMASKWNVASVDMGSDHVVMLSTRAQCEEASSMKPLIADAKKNVHHYLNLSLTVSMGPLAEKVVDLPLAYRQTHDISNERFKCGRGQIHDMDLNTYFDSEAKKYVYPEDQERKMIEECKLGHVTEVIDALDLFVEEIKDYSYSEIRLSLTQLILSIGKAFIHLPYQNDHTSLLNLDFVNNQIDSRETLHAVREWIISIFSSLIQAMITQRSMKHVYMNQDMIEFIKSELANPNLSTKMIADHFGLSVNYCRVIFKDQTGEALSEYIRDRRLEKAKELLKTTTLTAEEICFQAGFNSVNYFYHLFKKETGLSPIQYRNHD
jgi:AraC-like DNA-binding protein